MSSAGSKPRAILLNMALLGGSVVVALVFAEIALNMFQSKQLFLPYHANAVYLNYPSEKITPGVSGVSKFTTNSYGLRGADLESQPCRILTIGGSTTADDVLDDTETWSHQLMVALNEFAGRKDFCWVGSSGIAGLNSDHHLMHARYLLPIIPRQDVVIVHVGINDVGKWLYAETFDPNFLDDQFNWNNRLAQSFKVSNYTPADYPIYKRLQLYKLMSRVKASLVTWRNKSRPETTERVEHGAIVMDNQLQWLTKMQSVAERRQRKLVPKAKLNTFPQAIEAYKDNLRKIVDDINKTGAKAVFMSQILADFRSQSETERKRFWMGAVNGGEFYANAEQFREFLDLKNTATREIVAEKGGYYIDLEDLVGVSSDLFYDHMHYNEQGARRVGRAVATYLKKHLWSELTVSMVESRYGLRTALP